MWIKTTTDLIDSNEPQLGSITDTELIAEQDEGMSALLDYLEDNQECPEIFTVIDDYADEDIELQTSDFLSSKQIDMLNDMFMADNDWDKIQIEYILDNLQLRIA